MLTQIREAVSDSGTASYFWYMWEKVPSYLKNKYSLTILFMLVWLTFFDQNNLIIQIQNKWELMELDEEREYYLVEIEKTKKDLHELTSDMANLERFAREKYLMKRDNEEVFVFVEE